jgi:N-acetylmuramic acid 6-phosphate etherase
MDHPMKDAVNAANTAIPPTERRHPRSEHLHELPVIDVLRLLNSEDRAAVAAAEAALPALARLVTEAAERVGRGGRVHYFGAGTSGRLGVLDAAELVPTFGIDPELVQAHIAGGPEAILRAVENSEDSAGDGERDALAVRPEDIVIGVTVSGTTPYVEGALGSARQTGATTALITSNPAAPLATLADHVLVAETGPEVLTGSTRLNAGTATKILLNGFSTALMVRMGLAYSNLMVSVLATNHKLRERTLRILGELTGGDRARDIALLDEAGGDLRVAVVSVVAGTSAAQAREALGLSGGSVPEAVRALAGSQP